MLVETQVFFLPNYTSFVSGKIICKWNLSTIMSFFLSLILVTCCIKSTILSYLNFFLSSESWDSSDSNSLQISPTIVCCCKYFSNCTLSVLSLFSSDQWGYCKMKNHKICKFCFYALHVFCKRNKKCWNCITNFKNNFWDFKPIA